MRNLELLGMPYILSAADTGEPAYFPPSFSMDFVFLAELLFWNSNLTNSTRIVQLIIESSIKDL